MSVFHATISRISKFTKILRAASRKMVTLVIGLDSTTLFRHDGGRYRIRTYDFHRVKMALYR
jgi:hypothetical protein